MDGVVLRCRGLSFAGVVTSDRRSSVEWKRAACYQPVALGGRMIMVRKRCGRCHNISYSLSARGRWVCPECGEDLTDAPLERPDRSTANIVPVRPPALEPHDLN